MDGCEHDGWAHVWCRACDDAMSSMTPGDVTCPYCGGEMTVIPCVMWRRKVSQGAAQYREDVARRKQERKDRR